MDMVQFKDLNRKLEAMAPREQARRLSYAGAVKVEAQIIKSAFRGTLGMRLSDAEVAELKHWDSPIKVLQAFVSYCLKCEEAIVEYSMSREHILGFFLLTADDYIRTGRVEMPVELLRDMEGSRSETRDMWRKRLVLLANLSAIEIHNRSRAVAAEAGADEKGPEVIGQALEQNYRKCYQSLKEKLCRRAS